MHRALFRRTLAPACAVIAFLAAGAVHAQPMEVGAPLWSTGTGDKPVQSDGAALQNLGLVGVARLPADSVDFLGDTLGSISGMAIARAPGRRTATPTPRASTRCPTAAATRRKTTNIPIMPGASSNMT